MIDIVGFTIEEAREKLATIGMQIGTVEVISQPRDINVGYQENYRIVKQQSADGSIINVLVCKS